MVLDYENPQLLYKLDTDKDFSLIKIFENEDDFNQPWIKISDKIFIIERTHEKSLYFSICINPNFQNIWDIDKEIIFKFKNNVKTLIVQDFLNGFRINFKIIDFNFCKLYFEFDKNKFNCIETNLYNLEMKENKLIESLNDKLLLDNDRIQLDHDLNKLKNDKLNSYFSSYLISLARIDSTKITLDDKSFHNIDSSFYISFKDENGNYIKNKPSIFRIDVGMSRGFNKGDFNKETAYSRTPQVLKIEYINNEPKISIIKSTFNNTSIHMKDWDIDPYRLKYLKYKTKYLKLKSNII